MEIPTSQKSERLAQSIQETLAWVERDAARLGTLNASFLIGGIVTSAATTLVNGITAAEGPLVGEGVPGWRLACIAGAVLAFITTVCMGVSQQLKLTARSAKASECAGRLRSLIISLDIGNRSVEDVSEEYARVLTEFAEVLRKK